MYQHDSNIHNKKSALEIIPLILELFPNANSVVDVGCGLGEWLSVFKENGIKEIKGINGEWVEIPKLYIDKDEIHIWDLTKTLKLNKKFDLVLCLEVAEHLPESAADTIVKSLTQLGENIIFSAAIPYQGGQNHLNENWPEYWKEKFNEYGFYFYDCLRPKIWDNPNIFPWYKQNLFLVSSQNHKVDNTYLNLVHPTIHENKMRRIMNGEMGLRFAFQILKVSIINFFKRN